jgi:hypothetical protein
VNICIVDCAQVNQSHLVNLPASSYVLSTEEQLQVLVRAEGPTCVLTVADTRVSRNAICAPL